MLLFAGLAPHGPAAISLPARGTGGFRNWVARLSPGWMVLLEAAAGVVLMYRGCARGWEVRLQDVGFIGLSIAAKVRLDLGGLWVIFWKWIFCSDGFCRLRSMDLS